MIDQHGKAVDEYTFKVLKGGKPISTVLDKQSFKDKSEADKIWSTLQKHYESRWEWLSESRGISMYKNGKEVQHLDYEV
jgi:hypothetical protein